MSKSGHFYNRDGVLVYDANLRDAKKWDYYPSITTVQNVVAKPNLTNWIQDQILQAGLRAEQHESESTDDFIQRVKEESREKSSVAVEFGKAVHKAIENICNDKPEILPDRIARTIDYIDQTIPFSELSYGNVEQHFVSEKYGYGGTVDWFGVLDDKMCVLDWKTQGVKWKEYKRSKTDCIHEIEKNGIYLRPTPVYYDEMITQLWASGQLITENTGIEIDHYMSVIVNSDEKHPEIIDVKYWSDDEVEWGKKTFLAMLELYRLIKRFPYNEEGVK